MPILALAVALHVAAPAGDAQPDRILVLDIASADVSPGLLRSLSEIMVATVRSAAPGAVVVSQEELKVMLMAEEQKILLGCSDDTSCLAEIGGAIGAAHLVTASLGQVGSVYVFSVKMIDTSRAEVVNAVTRTIKGGEEDLLDAIASQTATLLAAPAAAAAAPAEEPAPPSQPTAQAQPPTVPAALPPAATTAEAQPPELDGEPWYQNWWVWTLGGAVVAGAALGIGLGVGLQQSAPSVGGSVNIELQPPGGS